MNIISPNIDHELSTIQHQHKGDDQNQKLWAELNLILSKKLADPIKQAQRSAQTFADLENKLIASYLGENKEQNNPRVGEQLLAGFTALAPAYKLVPKTINSPSTGA